MSEEKAIYGCIALSTATLTLLMVAEALGVQNLPIGGAQIVQAAVVYFVPLGLFGIYFAIRKIREALSDVCADDSDSGDAQPSPDGDTKARAAAE